MANSKVELASGEVLIDISQDTVTPQTLLQGASAHGADGNVINGAVVITTKLSDLDNDVPFTSQAYVDNITGGIDDRVDAVEQVVPPQATALNQLADKNFVNSSIATNTAYFRGTYDSVEELEAYSGEKTLNDYAFVVEYDPIVITEVVAYNRYKWNGTSWTFEYMLNNSSFTSVQWAAIQSGITASKIQKYDGYEATIETKLDSARLTHETFTFIYEDGTATTKEIVLWIPVS